MGRPANPAVCVDSSQSTDLRRADRQRLHRREGKRGSTAKTHACVDSSQTRVSTGDLATTIAVRRVVVLGLALLASAVGVARGGGPASPLPLPCGLPQVQPLWVDFADGSVPFWSTIFARPGIVGAASNFIIPPQLRAKGAQTVYFDLYLNNRVGTPSKPADPSVIQSRADKLFDIAVTSSGCDHPLMA